METIPPIVVVTLILTHLIIFCSKRVVLVTNIVLITMLVAHTII